MDLMELAVRVEAAEPDEQRELLFEAWHAINDVFLLEGDQARADYFILHARFVAMLDAKAYESAAMTLVPEGVGLSVQRYWIAAKDGPVWSAEIATGGLPDEPRQVFDAYDCVTPALALTAACLKALAQSNNTGEQANG